MKKFKPLYTFASLWKQFVMFTKNFRRKDTGELVCKDTLELGDVTANDIEVRDIKCRKVTATGEIKTSSKITATGVVKGSSFDGDTAFETIKDRDEHLRFIEGDFTPTASVNIEYNFSKWSLSGSHLMIAMSGKLTAGASISSYEISAEVALPDWILDKLIPSANDVLDFKTVPTTSTGYSQAQSLSCYCAKSTGKIVITSFSSLTVGSDDEFFRIQFDFIIDNAETE